MYKDGRMAKTIAVSDDVYKFLSKIKRPGESFSDVIRSLKEGAKLSDIAGSETVPKEEWRRVTTTYERQKKLDEERRKRLLQ